MTALDRLNPRQARLPARQRLQRARAWLEPQQPDQAALAGEGLEGLDKQLLPMESGLTQWPDVHLSGDSVFYLRQGQPVLVPNAPTDGWVRLYEGKTRFMGMGEILDDGRVAPRRLMSAT